jgi:hypothetical protein
MTQHLCRHDSTSILLHGQVILTVSSSAWLGINIVPRLSHLDIATPTWLDSDIAPWSTSTRQRHHQHDSTTTSHHSQHRISSVVASMTRHWYHTAATSSWQRHRRQDSIVTSRRDQRHLNSATTNTGSAALSSAWLRGLTCTSPISNSTQRFTTDQTRWLEEYHSNRQQNLGTLLPTSPTLTREARHHHNDMGHFAKPPKSFS